MTNVGIKVSQLGVELNESDDEQLVYSSKFDTLKIHMEGNGTANPDLAGSAVTETIAHGLSYIPAFTVFTEIKSFCPISLLVSPFISKWLTSSSLSERLCIAKKLFLIFRLSGTGSYARK